MRRLQALAQWLMDILTAFPRLFFDLSQESRDFYVSFVRYVGPLLAGLLVSRCALPLMTFRREPEIWAWLVMPGGEKIPVTHWENVIGRSRSCDVRIGLATVSRNHAVLTRYDDGSWTVTDTHSRTGTEVNGREVTIGVVRDGDTIGVGGVRLKLKLITPEQERLQAKLRSRPAGVLSGFLDLMLLTAFQMLTFFGYAIHGAPEETVMVMEGYLGLIAVQWLLFLFYILIRRASFQLETLAFFLCSLCLAAIAAVCPEEVGKQLLAVVMGIGLYLLVGFTLRDLERAKRFRYLAAVLGLGLLLLTLLIGREYYGSRSWIRVAGMSLQPSELSKICFVFTGASAMDRIMSKRNLFLFIVYSVLICGCLAVMNDFGTALIFFCTFLMIAYLRSGSMGTVALAITALVIAGILAVRIAPHALKRFAAWRHIWEDPYNAGYQQTQALMAIASGGLLGLGPGRGWLRNVFAADSDIVFATICEEWGLLLALLAVAAIAAFGFFAIRSARVARSSFYSIGACTAAGILLVQTILNVLGTVDILPFTGVTLPFVSNGGTSMMGAWGLLAFVKAGDTRQNASFAVRLGKGRGKA